MKKNCKKKRTETERKIVFVDDESKKIIINTRKDCCKWSMHINIGRNNIFAKDIRCLRFELAKDREEVGEVEDDKDKDEDEDKFLAKGVQFWNMPKDNDKTAKIPFPAVEKKSKFVKEKNKFEFEILEAGEYDVKYEIDMIKNPDKENLNVDIVLASNKKDKINSTKVQKKGSVKVSKVVKFEKGEVVFLELQHQPHEETILENYFISFEREV